MMMRSEGWKPAVYSSSSEKPDEMPVTDDCEALRDSSIRVAFFSSSLIFEAFFLIPAWEIVKNCWDASSTRSKTSMAEL